MRIQLRRGLAAAWASKVPAVGEPAYATDSKKLAVGDGVTTFASLPAIGSGSGTTVRVVLQAPLTSGNVTVADSVLTQVGSDLTIAAAAGDRIRADISCLVNGGSAIPVQFEAATRVSNADTNYFSSGNGTSLKPGGVPPWYCELTNFHGPRGGGFYTVQSGDISGGNVTVRLYAFGAGGTRAVVASAVYPMSWSLTNLGAS